MLQQPTRLVDTRSAPGGPVQPGAPRCFDVAGQGGIPADATGVVLNATAVGQGGDGWLTLYPAGQPVPATSTLNFDADVGAVANGAITRLGGNGELCVSAGQATTHVILDAAGYLPSVRTVGGLLGTGDITFYRALPISTGCEIQVEVRNDGTGPLTPIHVAATVKNLATSLSATFDGYQSLEGPTSVAAGRSETYRRRLGFIVNPGDPLQVNIILRLNGHQALSLTPNGAMYCP